MKFAKDFESHMVPEWQRAYMDYNNLKLLLRDIQAFKEQLKNNNNSNHGHHHHYNHHDEQAASSKVEGTGAHGSGRLTRALSVRLTRAMTMYRPFGGLLTRTQSFLSKSAKSPSAHFGDIEDQVILEVQSSEGTYETKFLVSSLGEGREPEVLFFKRLDDEFNKVNKFYQDKVEEVMKEATELNRQMDALIAFRIKVHDNAEGTLERFHDHHHEIINSKQIDEFHASCEASTPTAHNNGHGAEHVHMDVIEESELSVKGNSDGDDDDEEEENSKEKSDESATVAMNSTRTNGSSSVCDDKQLPERFRTKRKAAVSILSNVKINNTLETPRETIKRILNLDKNQDVSFGRENLKKVEEKLRQAFIEFYHKLELLKSYSFMNLSAFSKIMSKYDKITSRSASRTYLNMVDNSYLGNSDDVTKLMERVEVAFVKHFAHSNRSKGMNMLRPKVKRERHRTSFSFGFFFGCTVALLVALILIIRARNIVKKEGSAKYMETMFPLYSLFGFAILHMVMYGGNIYFWKRYRINYQFIFGLKKGTELGYREVFLLSAALSTLSLAAVLANLDMEMDVDTKEYETLTELVPLGLVTLIFLIMVCPFNIIYRSTRFFFIKTVFRCFCAPFYKVTLPDFFMADQLSSQAQALRSLEFYICYYGWGDFRRRQSNCKSNSVYSTFYFMLAVIPFWWRFLQCARRFFEESDKMQGYNSLKYFSIIVAILVRTAYSKQQTIAWWVLAWVTSIAAGVVATWWDIYFDWGLLNRKSKNRWLRDKLLVSHKSVYFIAIAVNVVLRFAWLETVLNVQLPFLHREAYTAIVASLEVIRRCSWNFFRLENEHLNNVGHYRAFKSVPLPFNYDDEEDEDKED